MSEQADPAQRYEDMDEKLVLVQILAELQAIRTEVTDNDAAPTPPQSDTTDAADMYKCRKCQREVKAADRRDHALERHKAPPEVARDIFDPVSN
jgi:hypothetical protein